MTSQCSLVSTRRLQNAGVLAAVLLGLAALTPAWAAAPAQGKDCVPMGSLPTYHAPNSRTIRAYESYDFDVKKGDSSTKVSVAGAYCQQIYTPNGDQPSSDLEIQSNYRDQLGKLGAQILFTDDRDTDAKLVKGAQETWIQVSSQETSITVTVVNKRPLVQTLTAPSGKDYRLLGHMPNYHAPDAPKKRNFDEASFTVKDGDSSKDVKVQGALYEVVYVQNGAQLSSDLEIQGNYRNALKKLGAQILFTDNRDTDARLLDKGQTIWIQVSSQETSITVLAVEEKAFQATIKPAQASELKAALDKDGHVALYINFDFDKATLRPDAAPVMAQVLALLKGNPDLKLSIVGNTDNVGGHDYNVKLSQARAATVVATLVKDGIAAARLTSSGDGPDKPIADNDSSEGRAKNRRVELVKT